MRGDRSSILREAKGYAVGMLAEAAYVLALGLMGLAIAIVAALLS